MASKKKKIQVTQELETREELNPFLDPNYQKVVVINAFEPFWGRCEVAEMMLKKFSEEPGNMNKVDWISIPCQEILDILPKVEFGAKPIYFIFVKGELFCKVEGIDFPALKMKVIESYTKFEEAVV